MDLSTPAQTARRSRALKVLETTCATCGAYLKLTGTAREHAVARGRGYCPPPKTCGEVGGRARLSAAQAARMMDPVERARCGRDTIELPVCCATCGKSVVLTGNARRYAIESGRGYCSQTCSDAGRAANISAALTDRTQSTETRLKLSAIATAQWANPAERELAAARSTAMWSDPETRAKLLAAIIPAHWVGNAVRYNGRHARLEATLGRASERLCVDCDRQADDWSLNPGTASEYLRADDAGPDQGRPFSLLDGSYSARCRSCHTRLDKGPGRSVVVPQRKPSIKFEPRPAVAVEPSTTAVA